MSVLAGVAFGTPIGAMAVDVTHAQTDLASGSAKGQSMRLSYSKNVLSTGSNFSVAAYRFSTRDYLDFSNAVQLLDAEKMAGTQASSGVRAAVYQSPQIRAWESGGR